MKNLFWAAAFAALFAIGCQPTATTKSQPQGSSKRGAPPTTTGSTSQIESKPAVGGESEAELQLVTLKLPGMH